MNKRVGGSYLIYNVFEIKNTIKKINVNNKVLLTKSWHPYSSEDLNGTALQMSTLHHFEGRKKTYNYNSYVDENSRKSGEKFTEKHIDISVL